MRRGVTCVDATTATRLKILSTSPSKLPNNSKMRSEPAIESEKAPSSPRDISAGIENPRGFDKDIAAAIVGERRQVVDPTVEARVVRKIDWFLVPAMSVGYGLVYYDKVNESASIMYSYTDFGRPFLGPQSCSA